jgi:hypothetical protein
MLAFTARPKWLIGFAMAHMASAPTSIGSVVNMLRRGIRARPLKPKIVEEREKVKTRYFQRVNLGFGAASSLLIGNFSTSSGASSCPSAVSKPGFSGVWVDFHLSHIE